MEAHTAFVLTTPVDRLTEGIQLFQNVTSIYGVLFPSFLAFVQKSTNVLDWGATIRAICWLQMIFVVVASLTFFKYAERSKAPAAIATLVLIPVFPCIGVALFYPNIYALRYLGFLLVCLFLLFFAPKLKGWKVAASSGVIGGLSLLLNLETGMCACVGLIVYTIARQSKLLFPSIGTLVNNVFCFSLGILSALLIFETFLFCAFGYWVPLSSWLGTIKTILRDGSSGISGNGSFTLFPLPVIIACHSAYVISVIAGAGKAKVTARTATTLSLAVINILWSIYYFNTPKLEAYSGNLYLYLFLFIDLITMLSKPERWFRQKWLFIGLFSILFVFFVETGVRFIHYRQMFLNHYASVAANQNGSTLTCGIKMSDSWSRELLERAEYLKAVAKRDGLVCYLTNNSVFISKLSGVQPNIPMDDIFFSFKMYKENIKFVDGLAQRGERLVLVDPPDPILKGALTQQQCVETYRLLLRKYYVLESTHNGWQHWVLKKTL